MTEFAAAAVLACLPLVYVYVWALWARPRLLTLRSEARLLRYRVPRRLVALYVAGALLAPAVAGYLLTIATLEAVSATRGRYL